MAKKLKRPLSIILSIIMIVSVFAAVPMTAYAAPTESLLITINSEGHGEEWGDEFISGSRTFNNIATVTFSSEVENDDDDDGWYNSGWSNKILSVAPAAGYTITKVKFYNRNGSAIDETSPFEATLYAMEMYVNGSSCGRGGVTKIEVYGYAAPTTYTVTWKNGDTTLKTDTVDKDATPAYTGTVPEKAEDEQYTYTFSGWTDGTNTYGASDTLPAVTGDVTYTATFTSSAKYTYTLDGDNATITGYNGTDQVLTIPSEIDGQIVVKIEPRAFAYKNVKYISCHLIQVVLYHLHYFGNPQVHHFQYNFLNNQPTYLL